MDDKDLGFHSFGFSSQNAVNNLISEYNSTLLCRDVAWILEVLTVFAGSIRKRNVCGSLDLADSLSV
jgi:hypothetical protein